MLTSLVSGKIYQIKQSDILIKERRIYIPKNPEFSKYKLQIIAGQPFKIGRISRKIPTFYNSECPVYVTEPDYGYVIYPHEVEETTIGLNIF